MPSAWTAILVAVPTKSCAAAHDLDLADVVDRVAERVGLRHRFTTHTLRHLCLTHLARAGWSLQDLAIFAGHRNLQTTLMYIHLSGRELGPKYDPAMQQIRSWAEQAAQ